MAVFKKKKQKFNVVKPVNRKPTISVETERGLVLQVILPEGTVKELITRIESPLYQKLRRNTAMMTVPSKPNITIIEVQDGQGTPIAVNTDLRDLSRLGVTKLVIVYTTNMFKL